MKSTFMVWVDLFNKEFPPVYQEEELIRAKLLHSSRANRSSLYANAKDLIQSEKI